MLHLVTVVACLGSAAFPPATAQQPEGQPTSATAPQQPDPKPQTPPADKPEAGKPDAGKPDAGKPDAGKPAAGNAATAPTNVSVGKWATVALPPAWRWLPDQQGRKFLQDMGNPPDPGVLGVAVHPKDVFVVFSYDDDGHVDDADAAGTDFNELLASMKDDLREANPARKKHGYPTIELLGWAEPPHYDKAARKLYWAKHLKFDQEDGETVNYDVRVLGRAGCLVLQAVGDMTAFQDVASCSQELLTATEFNKGQRYDEFDPGYDKLAAYGIGGLVAGKLFLKAGLFKLLLKPLLVVGGLILAAVAKMFGGRRKAAAATTTGRVKDGG